MLKYSQKIPHIDKIFILNLQHRTDRLEFQKKQFYDLKIGTFIRIDPVLVEEPCKFLNKSIRSVYLSHLKIIKQITDENITALVLEDDVIIKNLNKVKKCLNILFNEINDWDMFYFYNNSVDINSKELDGKNIISTHRGLLCKMKKCIEAHAYIINKNKLNFIYNKLEYFKNKIEKSNEQYGWKSHLDQALVFEVHPYINLYGTMENLIVQDRQKFGSDNIWT